MKKLALINASLFDKGTTEYPFIIVDLDELKEINTSYYLDETIVTLNDKSVWQCEKIEPIEVEEGVEIPNSTRGV